MEDRSEHGYDGPLDVEPHDLAPISKLILESMESQGLPLYPDMFSTGESPHGCGHVPRTHYKGDRTTSANYFASQGPNLVIKTETTVDKVILEGSGSNLRAAVVKVINKDGSSSEIKARKEIIISGGAYCSPTVLLRSGLGPKDELAAHGIDCKVDLPGVGKNLIDHLVSSHLMCLFFTHTPRSSSSSTKLPSQALPMTTCSTSPTLLARHIANGKKRSAVLSQPSHSVPLLMLVSMRG